MTGDRGMVAENSIFDDGTARSNRFEEIPQMGCYIIPIMAAVNGTRFYGFLSRYRIVLGMPLLGVL